MDLESFNAGNGDCWICTAATGPENGFFYGAPFHDDCLNTLGTDWNSKITVPPNPLLLFDWVKEQYYRIADMQSPGLVVVDDSERPVISDPPISVNFYNLTLPGKCFKCNGWVTLEDGLFYGTPWHPNCLDSLGDGWRFRIGNNEAFWDWVVLNMNEPQPNEQENEQPTSESTDTH